MLYHPRKMYQVLSRCTDVGKAALLQHPNVWIIESSIPALVAAAAAPIWKLVLQNGGLLLAGLDIASYPGPFHLANFAGWDGTGYEARLDRPWQQILAWSNQRMAPQLSPKLLCCLEQLPLGK